MNDSSRILLHMTPGPELRAGVALRWLRAGTLAGVTTTVGTVAHISAGGLLPPVTWAMFGLAVLTSAFATLLGRPATRRLLVLLVCGGQFLVHGLLTASAGHAGDHRAPHHGAGHGLSHAGGRAGSFDPDPVAAWVSTTDRRGSLFDLTTGSTALTSGSAGPEVRLPHWLGHVVADLTGPHALMMLVHLMAAALVALWLAVGEQAIWVLVVSLALPFVVLGAAWLQRVVPCLVGRVNDRVARGNGRARHRVPPLPPPLVGALARRGPPLPACS